MYTIGVFLCVRSYNPGVARVGTGLSSSPTGTRWTDPLLSGILDSWTAFLLTFNMNTIHTDMYDVDFFVQSDGGA